MIGGNLLRKARRYMIYNLSTFDCFTEKERALYNSYGKCSKKDDKTILRKMFEDEVSSFKGVRTIVDSRIKFNGERKLEKMIAGFENECVRLSESFVFDEENPKNIPFIPEIIILDCYNEEILSQIIDNGLIVEEREYVFYSSSANQQKKKQVCLLECNFYEKHYERFMCGLALDIVNNSKEHGCNTGKYLAYTSLIFSKSVEMDNSINIDNVLVLPEFETLVEARVNFLSMENHTIDEREMSVPINHMDGAGMFLPGTLPSSCQIRGGWIKGCVFQFDFRQFIIEKIGEGKISENDTTKDIWGDDVSLGYIRDNVKLILNGSQLKMWKYYNSWEEYKEAFKKNGLSICINNALHYPTTDNPLTFSAYQFYQTIPRKNITQERIENLCKLTIEKINDAKTKPEIALEIMGIDLTEDNVELDAMKASIVAYPSMLHDISVKKSIKSNIESQRKKAMSGKPLIGGFYNYICPDLYAACERWFLGIENPTGLIPSNCVYNSFYDDKVEIEEVCCLRSPHLSDCEHGMRTLVKTDECKKWFHGMDTVISTHDLLTKTLQCDVDGDECLIVHDKAFIDLVDRDKLPLYYEMRKGESVEVNNENIKKCLHNSFQNSVIGKISNALTKHLNEQEEPDLEFVRYMTAYNNFCIDFPKSQYMPKLPNEYEILFEELQSEETLFPYFFKYAKDKMSRNCYEYADNEKSSVNRISKYIMNKTKSNKNNIWMDDTDKKEEEGLDKEKWAFNPEYLQSDSIKVDRKSKEYEQLYKVLAKLKMEDTSKNRKRIREKCNEKESKILGYDAFYHYCCGEILNVIGMRKVATAYLVDMEYHQEVFKETSKEILWNCFGDILYANLCNNLKKDPKEMPTKRTAYQSRADKELERAKLVKAVIRAMEKDGEIPIYQEEYDWFINLECRKNSQYDKFLLYILLVHYKRKLKYLDNLKNNDENITEDMKAHVKLYKNRRMSNKVTRATLDGWLEHDITDKGLRRLEDKNIIGIEDVDCKKYRYYKIYLKTPFDLFKDRSKETPLFMVGGGNPMISYYQYSGERKIKECEICGKLFPVVGNMKTCGDKRCSDKLRLLNKNSA